MAEPVVEENPILEAVIDNIGGRVFDLDVIQGLVDQVRAGVAANATAYSEAETQLAEARRLLAEAVEDIVAGLPPRDPEEEEEEELVVELHDPETVARAAAYVELAARVGHLSRQHELLFQALVFLVLLRAIAFVHARARLVPAVLLAVAAAYAIAYVASWGRVVPGPASIVRILVLLLCFLLGRGPRLMLHT